MKHFILLLLSLLFFLACQQETKQQETTLTFETMGTWGVVKIVDMLEVDTNQIKKDLDNILQEVNANFSTYIDTSLISQFNALDTGKLMVNKDFIYLTEQAIHYAEQSNYAFNPKVMPLISYYGFAKEHGHQDIDSNYIDSLRLTINGNLNDELIISKEQLRLNKLQNIQLDYSAFAKGYGVDVVYDYLESKGFANFMIEIGGEIRTKGKNAANNWWRMGIEKPEENNRSIFAVVSVENKAMATSGNYRNFKVLADGRKIVHILNPKTGYSEPSNLLSASIIAPNCMTADAYATACMVMGVDLCFNFVLKNNALDAYLIYSDSTGQLQYKATKGMKKMLVE